MRLITASFVLTLLLSPLCLVAQQPTVLHAQLTTESAQDGLPGRIDQIKKEAAPAWVGYQIAIAPSMHGGSGADGVTLLEGDDRHESYGNYQERNFDHVNVLLRIANGSIGKLRIQNPDRQLDAGGLRFVWLTNVAPAESVHLLQSVALTAGSAAGPDKLRDSAVFLISLHQSPETVPALTQLAASSNPLGLREKAAFWLANRQGHEGFLAIQRLAREDGDPVFREKLTFDLTLTHDPAAADELIRMGKEDASPRVRRQAQFWMAQLGGKKITAGLRDATEKDPDAAVRKSAVFALSRLPGDDAATQLIQVAQTSKDAAVRKQAVFWLGQSKDPRAFDYLAQLIRQ